MISTVSGLNSQVSGNPRFDRPVYVKLGTGPVHEQLDDLVNHRGAPTFVEPHVRMSIDSVRVIYRLLLVAWRHAEQASGGRS